MLTFDEARRVAEHVNGREFEAFGWGDSSVFYIPMILTPEEELLDGLPVICAVDATTGSAEMIPPDPLSMERVWNATETYGNPPD